MKTARVLIEKILNNEAWDTGRIIKKHNAEMRMHYNGKVLIRKIVFPDNSALTIKEGWEFAEGYKDCDCWLHEGHINCIAEGKGCYQLKREV